MATPCKRGHIGWRNGSGVCVECKRAENKARKSRPEIKARAALLYRTVYKDKMSAAYRETPEAKDIEARRIEILRLLDISKNGPQPKFPNPIPDCWTAMVKPCKRAHLGWRNSSGVCIQCIRVRNKRIKATEKGRADHNRREAARNARPDVKQKRNDAGRQWRISLEGRAYQAAYCRARQALKAKATPSWLTVDQRNQMEGFYLEAARMNLESGARKTDKNFIDVDHIVPIKGKLVCGLHVPWNLQLLAHGPNVRKLNKWP
jgi:hypothetical protein